MNILVFGLLGDEKLLSKLDPISANQNIKKIFLVRKYPIKGHKIICFSPPAIFADYNLFCESYKILAGIYISIFYKPKYVIGVHYMLNSVLAGICSSFFKIKLIVLVVENPKLYDRNKNYFKLLKRCYKIGVRGSNSQKYLETKNIEEDKIFIPQNVFETVSKINIENKKYDLVFVGNLVRDKRPDIFVKVLAAVKKKLPNIRGIILGKGAMENQILNQIKNLSLQSNIEFLGYQKNVADYLSISKLLIMTSQTEGMPMVILEAMSVGVPCIVPDVGDITDVAINDYNSMVIKGLNIEHFSDAIVNCINDQILYKKLSNNSLKTISDNKEKYSMKSIAKEWEKVII